MPPKHPQNDRHFEGLSQRFSRNIYDTLKGQLRLRVLERDFTAYCAARQRGLKGCTVLDLGAGQGQFSLWLAQQGAEVTLNDASGEQLDRARKAFERATLAASWLPVDLWSLPAALEGRQFDGVCCHAVLEWLEQPDLLYPHLARWVAPGGFLSLLVYNQHGLVFKNLLRANYKKIQKNDWRGQKGSLTPQNPIVPETIPPRLQSLGFDWVCHSGVRVFHDYILEPHLAEKDPEAVLAIELALSQQAPYRDLGRYIHFLFQRRAA